ncbi:MAG TPA: DNA methyltransferase, partial [Rhodanobacteraceae bacterium]|nr:DNA methyltransferase [Rhodanobacteraceae bacterium]
FLKLKAEGRIYFGKDGKSQPSIVRYLSDVEGFVPWTWWPHEEVGHTDEARKEVQAIFGTQTAFDTPKPTRLLQRVIQIATKPGELILDSFAGSGTTAHAVLKQNAEDGGQRRAILVEMDKKIARDITAERVRRVAQGYRKANGDAVPGLGGGFRYATLGKTLFDARGHINSEVRFAELAHFVWFMETGTPLSTKKPLSPLLGAHHGRAVYLLYNGILKDKTTGGGNVLTSPLLADLPAREGPKTVYGARCLIRPERLRALGITFKQLPYELRVSK